MLRRTIAGLALGLFLGVSASAQTSVRGQVLMPDGSPPTEPLRFYFARDDGQINEYMYTDSKGTFVLAAIDNTFSYILTFTGDEATYGDNTYHLSMFYGRISSITVSLNPPPRKQYSPAATIAAAFATSPPRV